MSLLRNAAFWLTLALPMPLAAAPADLEAQVRGLLAQPDLAGTHWGLQVEDKNGQPIISIAPDERFQPASNTKVFVTAAAFEALSRGALPNPGTQVRLEPGARGLQNVVLVGKGDASLSDRANCQRDCLSQLADAVAASGVKRVGDVIGDDSFMPDERWVRSGRLRPGSRTIMSALTINDNELAITVTPGAAPGAPASAALADPFPELRLIDEVTTAAADTAAEVHAEIEPGQRTIRLLGSLPLGGKPQVLRFDVDDPADYAAIRFAALLRARGIAVSGAIRPRHAAITAQALLGTAPAAPETPALASLTPPDPVEDLTLTAKRSQNLHAHLWLKKLALSQGLAPSTPTGLAVLNAQLDKVGLPRWSHDFYDGSGLSPDNRITPRAMVRYLHWIDGQSWGQQWRAILPIAGVDGTLAGRLKNTPLAGNLRAKTGTLLAGNALAGYVTAASGRELVFAIYANDRPGDAPSVLPVMDKIMQVIAAGN